MFILQLWRCTVIYRNSWANDKVAVGLAVFMWVTEFGEQRCIWVFMSSIHRFP